jgi:hypothetical protein
VVTKSMPIFRLKCTIPKVATATKVKLGNKEEFININSLVYIEPPPFIDSNKFNKYVTFTFFVQFFCFHLV